MIAYGLRNVPDGIEHSDREVLDAAATESLERLVVLRNRAVYAVLGSAHPEVQAQICDAKGEGRGARQPVGWTVPFSDQSLSAFSVEKIYDTGIRELIQDPDALTCRLGAIAFVRGVADSSYAREISLPDSIVPPDTDTVQVWSPQGNVAAAYVIGQILRAGSQPIMTSANSTGEPEAVTLEAALQFARGSNPQLPVVYAEPYDKLRPPYGSYPVVRVGSREIEIIRPGCFSPEILTALLDGYPVGLADEDRLQKPNYPNGVMRTDHLPESDRTLRGPELRLAVLSYMGVDRDLT